MSAEALRSMRKEKVGRVVSDKMDKTIVVSVERENTCTAMILAAGATPGALALAPAAIDATWVPCWQPADTLFAQGAALPAPVAFSTPPAHSEVALCGE